MKIRFDQLVMAITRALDMVEIELLGASTNHGKRIAALCSAMGAHLGWDKNALTALSTCAMLHDNALTEYVQSEHGGEIDALHMHSIFGQRNVDNLPFDIDTSDFILHHHERADGLGHFGKREGECSLGSELIAIADRIDVRNNLQSVPQSDLPALQTQITAHIGSDFTARAADALLAVLDADMLLSLRDDAIEQTVQRVVPAQEVEIESAGVFRLASFVASIIDHKSKFTMKHSQQIANKAWLMGKHYNLERTLLLRIFLAAALHDIGKLGTPLSVLEKPNKLDVREFEIIKAHVSLTRELLGGIDGLEDVSAWAGNHHEKLSGTGYPEGKSGAELDFASRLLACVDIYQAVSEERPYHTGRSHAETMPIMYSMAEKGFIDEKIVANLDLVLAQYSGKDVPGPDVTFPD